MNDDAFEEFGAQYLLIPGQRLSAQDSISSIGISCPLPKAISQLFAAVDLIGHQSLVLTESDPLLVQWNPFTGVTPLLTDYALGVSGYGDHRWLQSIHEAGVKALYHQIHESVHAQWAAFAYCGGFKLIQSHERSSFHALAEASAVYFGDIEAPEKLYNEQFFDNYWPSGAYRSHAIAFSAIDALERSGLSKDQRREWLFEIYLDGLRSLPNLPKCKGRRAEALALLIEESSYAEKIEIFTTPMWLKYYWDRPELESFVKDFISPKSLTPTLKLPSGAQITDFNDMRSHWREISDGSWIPQERVDLLSARLHLQRSALKVCELISVFSSYRLCLSSELAQNALRTTRSARDKLLAIFHEEVLYSPLSADSEEEFGYCGNTVDLITLIVSEIVSELQLSLVEICGPVLFLDHPLLDSIPFGEQSVTLLNRDAEPREIGECTSILKRLREECKSLLTQLSGDLLSEEASLEIRLEREHAVDTYRRVNTLLGEIDIARDRSELLSLSERCESLFTEISRDRRLKLCYPIAWITAAPFIDPLIGFRYR